MECPENFLDKLTHGQLPLAASVEVTGPPYGPVGAPLNVETPAARVLSAAFGLAAAPDAALQALQVDLGAVPAAAAAAQLASLGGLGPLLVPQGAPRWAGRGLRGAGTLVRGRLGYPAGGSNGVNTDDFTWV